MELLGAEGGAVTLVTEHGHRTTVAVSDDLADRLEDLQEVLGEGPGPTAFGSGEPAHGLLVGDGQESPWPLLARSARELADRIAVWAFPMLAPRTAMGTITLYRRGGERLAQPLEVGAFLADAVGAALVRDAQESAGSGWRSRDRVNQAVGMVVAQLKVPPDDALALLRALAFSHAVSMDEVAEGIVSRRWDFGADSDSGRRGTR